MPRVASSEALSSRAGGRDEELFDALDICGNVNADGIIIGFDDADAETIFEPA